MASTPWFALYPSDYLADTAHLGLTEHGVYWRLLLHYYQHRQPLSSDIDKVCRIVLATSPEERRTVEYILTEFFVLTPLDDGTQVWRHLRADKEIADAMTRKEVNSARASAGAAARWKNAKKMPQASSKNASSIRQAYAEHCQSIAQEMPTTTTTTTINSGSGISYEIPPPVAGTEPGSRPASIPVRAIVDLYHELLPMCPRVQKITKARAGAIQARWRSGDLPDLETWADYFRYVSESAFLTGRVDPAPGRTRFVADLEWLAREGNYAKVYEGKFHRSKA